MLTGEPKGNGGSQPGGLSAEGENDPEFRQTTSGAHGSAGRADYGVEWDLSFYGRCPKVSKGRAESPLVRPQAQSLSPMRE